MKGSRFTEEPDYRGAAGAGGGDQDRRGLPTPRRLEHDILQVEVEVRRAGGIGREAENRRLKRLLADSLLNHAALKDLLGKNV